MGSRNAEGRVFRHKIATSIKWTALPGPACTPREIFTLIVASVDNLGRMQSDPLWWKVEMYRTRPDVTPKIIASALEHNHNVGLVYIYQHEGFPLLQKEPPKLVGAMKSHSNFSAPPKEWQAHLSSRPANFVKYQLVSGVYNVAHSPYLQDTYGIGTGRGKGKEEGEIEREIVGQGPAVADFKEIATRVLEYLNDKCGRGFSVTSETNTGLVTYHLGKGYTEEDFNAVVDCKLSEFTKKKGMKDYLRPSTLFGKEKFPIYVEQAREAGERPSAADEAARLLEE